MSNSIRCEGEWLTPIEFFRVLLRRYHNAVLVFVQCEHKVTPSQRDMLLFRMDWTCRACVTFGINNDIDVTGLLPQPKDGVRGKADKRKKSGGTDGVRRASRNPRRA